jgi:DNA-3-methyladenine glycosylase II
MDPIRQLECGFLRGSRTCSSEPNAVSLAFPTDGDFSIAGARLRWDREVVHVDATTAGDEPPLRAQLERILGLDHDATGFWSVIEKAPELRAVASSRPGFRPVVAYSPYVMGGWSILSQRLRMAQAAVLQVRIAEAAGDTVNVGGQVIPAFPRPQSILARSSFPGVPDEKWRRLSVLAKAALEGKLDVARLAATPHAQARAQLMELRGVGPWTADAILLRGCGPVDLLPLSEPTLHAAVAEVYRLKKAPTDAEVQLIAQAWSPYRMWVSVLLVSHYVGMKVKGIVPPGRRGRRATQGLHVRFEGEQGARASR